ncbi:hypothetical protein IGI04_014538 [Brassica rapa subsp. trilocularis]|uniref:CRM domain-containing protein n=1 Tax=Brassica rapa subsp. trilocularis TaxID=1813537 RepID=A0ABQ7MMG3_BRACM|nr:hypothetical protein IGI04_014538 [Brassica rapa subsp. trilocularis]
MEPFELSQSEILYRSRTPPLIFTKTYSLLTSASCLLSYSHAPPLANEQSNLQSSEKESKAKRRYLEKDKGQSSIERIVLRLRNLGLAASDDDEEDDAEDNEEEDVKKPVTEEERLGDLLKREWEKNKEEQAAESNEGDGGLSAVKKRRARASSLSELTIEDFGLRRLRRDGMYLRVRINIPKAGLTQAVMEKIHDNWRKEELVRLKFHERRTGGMVIWRAGSVMVVYRGRDYQGPSAVFNQMARPEEHYQGPSAGSVLVYSYLMREDEATLGKITKPRRPKTVVLCPTRELSEQIMRHMPEHPNVVTLRETYEDEHAVHLGMELCEGVELFDRNVARGHYTERAAAVVTKTIMAVVQVRHGFALCLSPDWSIDVLCLSLSSCAAPSSSSLAVKPFKGFHLDLDELGRFVSNKGNESVLKNFWHHTDAIICCSMKAMPVFIFANQAGLDMLETTLVSLQDISLEKIFDDNGRKTLCSEFPQIMQQGFASLQGGICLSSMGRPVSYERAVAWKVLNEEENAHCICFVFINWSFV